MSRFTIPSGYSDEQWNTLPVRERALISAAYHADQLKVRETGINQGPWIDAYLLSANLKNPKPRGYPYCAAFVTWHYTNGSKIPFRSLVVSGASACTILRSKRTIVHQGKKISIAPVSRNEVKRGDLFGWCNASKWQGHIGFVVAVRVKGGRTYIDTIEANTSPDPKTPQEDRDGGGVYRRTREVTNNFLFSRVTVADD